MTEYGTGPAGILRQVLGESEPSEYEARFKTELPDRLNTGRAFYEAWGLVDGTGRFTARAEELRMITYEHQRHLAGADWISLSEEEERVIVKRMRSAALAEQAMAAAASTGPGTPSYAAAQEKFRAAQEAAPGGPLRGVPNG